MSTMSSIKTYEEFLLESNELKDPQIGKFVRTYIKEDKQIYLYNMVVNKEHEYVCEIWRYLNDSDKNFKVGFDTPERKEEDTNRFEINKILSTVLVIIKEFIFRVHPLELEFTPIETDGDKGERRYGLYKDATEKQLYRVVPMKYHKYTKDDSKQMIKVFINPNYYKSKEFEKMYELK